MQPERPYVFEGVDQGGRWYNGNAAWTAFSSTCVNPKHNRNPFSKRRRRTDGPTTRRPTPPWQSPAGSSVRSLTCATKQQLHDSTTPNSSKYPLNLWLRNPLHTMSDHILGFSLDLPMDLRSEVCWTRFWDDWHLYGYEIVNRIWKSILLVELYIF